MAIESTSGVGSSTSGAAATSATSSVASTLESSGLGEDAFLQLLVTQLQNQDPTNPMDDTTFVTQLATFSSLEQLTTISGNVSSIDQLLTTAIPSTSSDTTSSTDTTQSTNSTSGI
jgi:flagellar basal-body rod modification protein FlgD